MMADIFSSFDSKMYNTLFPSNTMFLMLNTMLLTSIQMLFWLGNTRIKMLSHYMKSTIYAQLSHTKSINLKGVTLVISSMFIMLIIINLMGMIPYTYSTSSQLIFTLSLGFPMWLSFILSSTFYKPKKTIAHMLPDSAPMWLNPFLVIIESTSLLVRPLTLSFRLAANMSAGHIVMSLTGIYLSGAWFNNMVSTLTLLLMTTGYILFELTICVIQAYIFCLLLSLYSDDHMH